MRMNGAVWLHSWTSSSSTASTSLDHLAPAVVRMQVGCEAARVDRGAGGDALGRSRAGGERQGGQRPRRGGPVSAGASAAAWPRAPERDDIRERAARQRRLRGRGQVRVGLGRPPHGLRRVVDQDVERALGGDLVGEGDHLSGIAQVEADDAQAIDPVRAVVHRGEAPDRVVREARRDRRVGAVAKQPQRDVHPDLGPAAGEQRAPSAQIGARVRDVRGCAPSTTGRAGGRTRRPRGSAPCRCNTRGREGACRRACRLRAR